MSERGAVTLNLQRGAGVAEFRHFLADLENAYLALQLLPTLTRARRYRRRVPWFLEYPGTDLFAHEFGDWWATNGTDIYPEDQLELARISIQSPGWVELLGSLNPLQQLREYLKDRHERNKDRAWRSDAEKERARLENEILRSQAQRERIGVIGDCNKLLEEMGIEPDERQRILWERLGSAMVRLGQHQDTGLLGSQNDEIDGLET